jgi:serine/threonine protein kinase
MRARKEVPIGWLRPRDQPSAAVRTQETWQPVDVAQEMRTASITAEEAPRIGRYFPFAVLGQKPLLETLRARTAAGEPSAPSGFVLKVLRKEMCKPAQISRFLDVARMLRWTSLPGLPSLVDIGEGPGPIFAAFEFNEGVNLSQLRAQAALPQGCLDIRLVGLVGRKLAERLGPLHSQPDGPRVHGALSPGNVLVRPSGDVLLLDCGLAESLGGAGIGMGESWRFAAPEQLRGGEAEQASDLYAMGALLYFLYYGKPPFEAETPAALLARIKEGPPDFHGLHPAMAACLARMLSLEATARPKSAGEVMRQLSVALLSAQAGMALAAPAAPATAEVAPTPVPESLPDSEEEPTVPILPVWRPSLPETGENLDQEEQEPAVAANRRGAISADDPDVGVVYDDDDDEEEIIVAEDGTVKRRRRRRGIRLLAWTKSEFARKIFRYAWVPALAALIVGVLEGFLFVQSWRAARAESQRRDEAMAAERARLEALKPKLEKVAELPAGHLVLKISPPGATVWIDGKEAGSAPNTMLTTPGPHRVVIAASGYRMLRDVVDTSHGAIVERELAPAVFPISGAVGVNVACTSEGKYPVFVDGREIGAFCPIAGIRLDPGRHTVGIFVIPQNRIFSVDRDLVVGKPHQVQFSY